MNEDWILEQKQKQELAVCFSPSISNSTRFVQTNLQPTAYALACVQPFSNPTDPNEPHNPNIPCSPCVQAERAALGLEPKKRTRKNSNNQDLSADSAAEVN